MKPSPPPNKPGLSVQCPCGWSRMPLKDENPADGLRYHRIQVHNDQAAATEMARF